MDVEQSHIETYHTDTTAMLAFTVVTLSLSLRLSVDTVPNLYFSRLQFEMTEEE